jgi:hypothetical protein
MAKQPNLKERVAVLEEGLKLFEPPPEHDLALADSTARLRCARERSERLSRAALIFAWLPGVIWLAVGVVLMLR